MAVSDRKAGWLQPFADPAATTAPLRDPACFKAEGHLRFLNRSKQGGAESQVPFLPPSFPVSQPERT